MLMAQVNHEYLAFIYDLEVHLQYHFPSTVIHVVPIHMHIGLSHIISVHQ